MAQRMKKNNLPTFVCIGVMLLIGIVGMIIGFTKPDVEAMAFAPSKDYTAPNHPTAQNESLPVQAKRSDQHPSSEFHYMLNGSPVFEVGGKNGNIYLENPQSNEYYLLAEYRLQVENELIYRSAMLPPGWSITTDDLLSEVQAGQYGVDVDIFVYQEADSENYIACFEQSINITVLEG